MSILLDAGPSLNFLAVGQQNALIQVAAAHGLQLTAPRRVDTEVKGKVRDPRFARTAALRTWTTLTSSGHITIVEDELTTPELTNAVTRISGMPARDRLQQRKNLGEIMVLAHASVYAQQGHQVFVLIDESDGRGRAQSEQRWLQRNSASGSLTLWNTPGVLQEAARHEGWIVGGQPWGSVYDQMTKFDDGLPPRPSRRR